MARRATHVAVDKGSRTRALRDMVDIGHVHKDLSMDKYIRQYIDVKVGFYDRVYGQMAS